MIAAQSDLLTALFFVASMCMAGLAHVWWLKSRFSQRWRQPIDCGKYFRGRRVFGDNKMLRGFMVLPISAALSFSLIGLLWPGDQLSDISRLAILGFASGFGFMIGELPNSFIKRQLDIAPGKTSTSSVLRLIFAVVDRVDSTIVALLAASLVASLSVSTYLWIFFLGFVLHALFSAALHKVGVKDRAL